MRLTDAGCSAASCRRQKERADYDDDHRAGQAATGQTGQAGGRDGRGAGSAGGGGVFGTIAKFGTPPRDACRGVSRGLQRNNKDNTTRMGCMQFQEPVPEIRRKSFASLDLQYLDVIIEVPR